MRRRLSAWAVMLLLGAGLHPRSALAQPDAYALTKADKKLLDDCAAIDRLLEKNGLVYHDPGLEEYLAKLAQPFLPQQSPDYVTWRVRILREPLINAQALPNGSIYVNTGMLGMLENGDQLAGVLAHEITHVTNRHSFQFLKSYQKKVVTLEVIWAAASLSPLRGAAGTTISVVTSVSPLAMTMAILGYSRELEREADKTAVTLLTKSGHDAAQFARTFELSQERLDPEPVSTFYRSHPKNAERIAYVREMIGGRTVSSPAADPAYISKMQALIRHNIRMDLECRRFRTAVARAARLAETNPSSAENQYWLGEAYRSLGPRSTQPPAEERTDKGQNKAHKQAAKRTVEDEEAALTATPEGKAALESNRLKARECFERSAKLDVGLAEPHFGLGSLDEQQNLKSAALAEYRRYLELAPKGAENVLRVQRRIEILAADGGR